MKKADRLFSEYWRNKIGKCEHCGSKDNLQLCHIHTRNIRKLRYERKNTIVMCASCHTHFHNKPLEFSYFVAEKKGRNIVDWLIRESNNLEPLSNEFYSEVLERYKHLTNN